MLCTSRLPTERKPLPLRTKPCVYKPFTYRSLCLYVQSLVLIYFSTTLAMRAALKRVSALLFSHCSPFLERFGLCRDGGLLGMTVGQSSRRGRGCGGSLVALRVFSDSKDTELRTLEMTLPLCHVKWSRHRGTGPIRVTFSMSRCRAGFEHSLLVLQQFFPVFKHPSFILQC